MIRIKNHDIMMLNQLLVKWRQGEKIWNKQRRIWEKFEKFGETECIIALCGKINAFNDNFFEFENMLTDICKIYQYPSM